MHYQWTLIILNCTTYSGNSPPALLQGGYFAAAAGGGPWGAQRGRSPSVITPRCVRVYDIWDLYPAGRGQASSLPHRSRTASNIREARAVPGRSLLPPPRGGQKLAPGQGGAAWQRISPALPPCGGPLIRPATRDSSTGPLLATAAPHAAAPARVRPQRQCWQARAAAAAHAARSAAAAADCTTPPALRRPALPHPCGHCPRLQGCAARALCTRLLAQRYRAGFGGGLRPASVPARG